MGLSPASGGAVGGGCANGGGSSGGTCCNMSVKYRCRWRCLMSSGSVFFLGCFVLFGSVATVYVWFAFPPYYARAPLASPSKLGCQEDNEGSWSLGIFFGDSPFSLKPIEAMDMWSDKTAAWPVANPVVTCSSVSDAGFPSNFVADPFLYVQSDNSFQIQSSESTDILCHLCDQSVGVM